VEFSSIGRLVQHCRGAHPITANEIAPNNQHAHNIPFICDVCESIFDNMPHLQEHQTTHVNIFDQIIGPTPVHPLGIPPQMPLFAEKSDSRAESVEVDHVINTENMEETFECEKCFKVFDDAASLSDHEKNHLHKWPYLCETCGSRFPTRTALLIHERTHSDERPYPCDECGKSFRTSYKLAEHKILHTGVKRFVCDACGDAFAMNYTLKQHKRIHTGEREWICDECGKAFPRKGNLQRHMKVHR
jgi:uncharacterized Zn-finger protein